MAEFSRLVVVFVCVGSCKRQVGYGNSTGGDEAVGEELHDRSSLFDITVINLEYIKSYSCTLLYVCLVDLSDALFM